MSMLFLSERVRAEFFHLELIFSSVIPTGQGWSRELEGNQSYRFNN